MACRSSMLFINRIIHILLIIKTQIDAIENWPLYVHCNGSEIKDETFAFHGCSYSSVQSIIHYGLHSNHGLSFCKLMKEKLNLLFRSTNRRFHSVKRQGIR
jgi:hypothetical protein